LIAEYKRERMSDMKNYRKRLMITAILLLTYVPTLFAAAGMLLIYFPQLSLAEKELLGNEALIWSGVLIAVVTGIIYLIAGISGIMASRGKCDTGICKKMAIALIVIMVIDVIVSLLSVGITKKVSQFIIKMIILGIYLKAADEIY